MIRTMLLISLFLLSSEVLPGNGPASFNSAKQAMVDVYSENPVTLYCGCEVRFNRDHGGHPRNTGGRIDFESCDYDVYSNETRAERSEWEHLMPMSRFTEAFYFCDSRDECRENPIYRHIEANTHNLTLSVGEVNAVRSNYRLVKDLGGQVTHDVEAFGACTFRADTTRRLAEPPLHTRGFIARAKLYMADRYGLSLPLEEQQLLVNWHLAYPPSDWELERNARLGEIQGQVNPFVIGERTWTVGQAPAAEGLEQLYGKYGSLVGGIASNDDDYENQSLRGNKNSKIFHRPDCPSYEAMASHNIVEFSTADAAKASGYRLARNCP